MPGVRCPGSRPDRTWGETNAASGSGASGGVHALRGVNLTVEAGSVTGLIGPNGAGKLPGNAQDVFIGAGTVALAFYPTACCPRRTDASTSGGPASRRPVTLRLR